MHLNFGASATDNDLLAGAPTIPRLPLCYYWHETSNKIAEYSCLVLEQDRQGPTRQGLVVYELSSAKTAIRRWKDRTTLTVVCRTTYHTRLYIRINLGRTEDITQADWYCDTSCETGQHDLLLRSTHVPPPILTAHTSPSTNHKDNNKILTTTKAKAKQKCSTRHKWSN